MCYYYPHLVMGVILKSGAKLQLFGELEGDVEVFLLKNM